MLKFKYKGFKNRKNLIDYKVFLLYSVNKLKQHNELLSAKRYLKLLKSF